MNKNGKSNIVFLLLIPIILVLTLIVVDTIISYTNNKSYKKITENIIKEVMSDETLDVQEYSDEIKKKYERLGYDTEMLVVEANSYDVYVENEYAYFGLFSSFSNRLGEETEIKILGVPFKVRKNSVMRLKVTASYNYGDELEFEYTK